MGQEIKHKSPLKLVFSISQNIFSFLYVVFKRLYLLSYIA